jgi:hypothetical protein
MGAYAIFRAALGACFVVLTTASAFGAAPDAEARRDAQHRINVSGRQRMLSQRIAKAACLAAWDPAINQHLREMSEAHTLFNTSMKALAEGSAGSGFALERDGPAIFRTAVQFARQYDAAVEEFAPAFPAKPYQEELEMIYELSLPFLVGLNDAVEYIEAQHRDGHLIRQGLATALNVSGRQRMLSQKMAKELCMLASGYKAQETRAHLEGSIALFLSSHEALKRDLMQMKLDQKDAIALSAQLGLIERRWQESSEIYIRVSTGGTPSSQDVSDIAAKNDTFLGELDRAVLLYEAIDIQGSVSQ